MAKTTADDREHSTTSFLWPLDTSFSPQSPLYPILNDMPIGLILTDAQGKILFINSFIKQHMDVHHLEATWETWPDEWGWFVPGSTMAFPFQHIPSLRLLQGLHADPVEILLRNRLVPSGMRLRGIGQLTHDSKGTVTGTALFLEDVTECRKLEREVLEVTAREQQRMAQELHDGLCQLLTGLKFMCKVLVGKLTDRKTSGIEEVQEIEQLVSQALREADYAARGLYPIELETKGLATAISEWTEKIKKLYRVSCLFVCEKPVDVRNADVALHIYRIAQEAVVNAIKHAHAKNIVVWLASTDSNFTLLVRNDGENIPSQRTRQGLGWRIMHCRAEMIGAALQFEHHPEQGAILTCSFRDDLELSKSL